MKVMKRNPPGGGRQLSESVMTASMLASKPQRLKYLIDLIVASNVDEEDLVFPNEFKNNPTVVVNAESPLAFEFPAQLMGSQLW